MKIIDLIKSYTIDYDKEEHPFLLFDLAHVNENDHTKVLMGILKFNNCQFLPSFVQAIGAPELKSVISLPTDQKKAIGNKGTGFIDLYFECGNANGAIEKVIIENKIYGASDTDRQLARYIATAIKPKMSNDEFEKTWEKWVKDDNDTQFKEEDFRNIHVVYLTSDGTKKPKLTSLPKYFGNSEDEDNVDFEAKHINYYPINYLENIIPWLENDVLPQMPYFDEGIAIAGIRQYIASLKAMFSSKGNSDSIGKFVGELPDADVDRYNQIIETMDLLKALSNVDSNKNNNAKEVDRIKNEINKDEKIELKDLQLQPLIRELRAAATDIFSRDGAELGEDWKLYFTPSFIILYRQSWADLDTRKYSIPSIYLCGDQTNKFLKGDHPNWRLQVDHLGNNYEKFKDKVIEGLNLGPVARFDISRFVNCDKPKTAFKEVRMEYYKNIIINFDSIIKTTDGIVLDAAAKLKEGSKDFNLQVFLLEKLIEKWPIKSSEEIV